MSKLGYDDPITDDGMVSNHLLDAWSELEAAKDVLLDKRNANASFYMEGALDHVRDGIGQYSKPTKARNKLADLEVRIEKAMETLDKLFGTIEAIGYSVSDLGNELEKAEEAAQKKYKDDRADSEP